jgi:hypothetical protein
LVAHDTAGGQRERHAGDEAEECGHGTASSCVPEYVRGRRAERQAHAKLTAAFRDRR